MTNYTDIDLATALNLLAEKDTSITRYKEMSGAYEDSIERLNTERQRDLERLQNTIRKTDDFRDNLAKVADLIKPLLEDETIEPTSSVGEELIELLGIEMTEEMEISVTVTYSGTVTVPKGTGYTDFEVNTPSMLRVTLNDENVGELTWDEEEFDQH